jgi:hypothetical protein
MVQTLLRERSRVTIVPAFRLQCIAMQKLAERLLRELGFRVESAVALDPGTPHNNRLVRLRASDGREVVAKFYFRDDRHRLDREYTALSYLHAVGVADVPAPYLGWRTSWISPVATLPTRTCAPCAARSTSSTKLTTAFAAH